MAEGGHHLRKPPTPTHGNWISADSLLNGSRGTNFTDIWIKKQNVSVNGIHLKVLCAKWHSWCSALNALTAVWKTRRRPHGLGEQPDKKNASVVMSRQIMGTWAELITTHSDVTWTSRCLKSQETCQWHVCQWSQAENNWFRQVTRDMGY